MAAPPADITTILTTLRTLRRVFLKRGWRVQCLTPDEDRLWGVVADRDTLLEQPTLAMAVWTQAILDRNGVVCFCQRPGAQQPDVVVAMPAEKRLGIKTVRHYSATLRKCAESPMGPRIKTVLFVHAVVPTPQALAELKDLGVDCERFTFSRLGYFVFDSDLIAPMRKLAPKARAALLKRFGEGKLPTMLSTDPEAQMAGYKPGDVLVQQRVFQGIPKANHYYQVAGPSVAAAADEPSSSSDL